MELDSVELVMAIEREFDLEIPDAEARMMITAGDMYGARLAADGLTRALP